MPTNNKPMKKLKPGMGIYQVYYRPKQSPKGKPYGVFNLQTGGVEGRWHATKEEALAQARALYSKLGEKAKVHSEEIHNAFFCFADATDIQVDGIKWIEAIEPKQYQTPAYGTVDVQATKIDNFIRNFHNNVRGQEVAIDFEHGHDPSKGKKAAGWIRDMKASDSGKLLIGVEFTDPAKQEISNKEWRYFSLEWDDEWMHPDGTVYTDVVMGGGLTNRPVAKGLMPINFSELLEELEIKAESKEYEHSDPGTGSPPAPRQDEDGSDDPAIRGGWRRESPPAAFEPEDNVILSPPKGGNTKLPYELVDTDAHELLRVLELPVDADGKQVVEAAKIKFGELLQLRESADAATQEKEFSEKYPAYWSEHNRLMERDRDNSARTFSESVQKIRKTKGLGLTETRDGLSSAALTKVTEVHKKFAEGSVTLEDFEECIRSIVNGGIVQFGELGSSNDDELPMIDTTTANGIAGSRKLFAEVVAKVQRDNPGLDYKAAMEEAARKHPDLAEAYNVPIPA